jgi:ABC-type nitrate/sulfonate/bicarbonate transport system ATPase subunit
MRRRAPTWRTSLPAIRDRFDITIVLVTHDIDEAVYLSDLADMFRGTPARDYCEEGAAAGRQMAIPAT